MIRPWAIAGALAIAAPLAAQAPAPPIAATLMAPVIRTADCGKAQAWYEATLGMTVLMSRDLGAIHETMLAFAAPSPRPAFMLLCNATPTAPAPRGIGMSRLIVLVADLDAVVGRLDAGKLAHPVIHAPQAGVRVMTITDPEGNELELVERAQPR